MKTVFSLVVTSAVLALAPAASAEAPTAPAALTKFTVKLDASIYNRGRAYVLKGDKAHVTGTAKPAVPGEKVVVEIRKQGKLVGSRTAKVRKDGSYSAWLRVRSDGAMKLWAKHDATAAQERGKAGPGRFSAVVPLAHVGSSGAKVRLLQKGLARLGYVTPRGGTFGGATARAVLAFRKVNKMARITTAKKKIFRMLFAGKGGYKLRYPSAGKHVEFDWSRQVLVLASGGKADRIYHASSGKPSTPTVMGTFSFYRYLPGTNAKGMVNSVFFHGGYAIHGYHSVPTYAASHGCIRVPIPNSRSIYNWINLGDRIFVYR